MFLISRKFHSTWGIPGTEVHGTPLEQKMAQGRGWEWWPSVVWQFFWAWIVAPVILWRARNINDTHGWRLQTIACCISGLHATPMWLIALYVPGMAPVNMYWIPPQWICVSIMFIEIFAIFLPCWQVKKHQTLQQETLNAIALWQSRTQKDEDLSDLSGSTRVVQSVSEKTDKIVSDNADPSNKASPETSSRAESIYTMKAMEYTLVQNPEPLRKFSALRDFSGENIAFLTSVMDWSAKWSVAETSDRPATCADSDSGEVLRRQLFKHAVRIYATYCSPWYADFPINISDRDLRKLDGVFENAARILYGDSRKSSVSDVTPFDNVMPSSVEEVDKTSQINSNIELVDLINDKVQYWGDIPDDFNANVFDAAEKSIKYLVLTNTWPKFVKDMSERKTETTASKASSRLSSSRWKKAFAFKSKV